MTPIISPWAFYAMDICETLKVMSIFLAILFGLVGSGFFIASIAESTLEEDEKSACKKYGKRLLSLTIILLLVGIITPTESTITKMIIAQNVTYERLEVLGEKAPEIKNVLKKDIIDIIEAVTKTDNE